MPGERVTSLRTWPWVTVIGLLLTTTPGTLTWTTPGNRSHTTTPAQYPE